MKKTGMQIVLEELIDGDPMGKIFIMLALESMANEILEDEETFKVQNKSSLFNADAMIRTAKNYNSLCEKYIGKTPQPALNELNHDTG